jgi:hypothetical protein
LSQARPFADTWILRGSGATANTKQIIDDLPHCESCSATNSPGELASCRPMLAPLVALACRLVVGCCPVPKIMPRAGPSELFIFLKLPKVFLQELDPASETPLGQSETAGTRKRFSISNQSFCVYSCPSLGRWIIRFSSTHARICQKRHMARLAPV